MYIDFNTVMKKVAEAICVVSLAGVAGGLFGWLRPIVIMTVLTGGYYFVKYYYLKRNYTKNG